MKTIVLHSLPIILWCYALRPIAAPAANTDVSHVISPQVDVPVTADGRLDEAAWQQAASVGRLYTLGEGGDTLHDHTQARVLHTREALHVKVVCLAETDASLPTPGVTDKRIYRHDHVEVFLDPSTGTPDVLQLVVDRVGNMRSSHIDPAAAAAHDMRWQGAWRAPTVQTADGWTVEITVPFASLELDTPEPGHLWRLKICRDGGREGPLCWPRNLSTSFHDRDADGALYFETMNLLENGDFEDADPKPDGVPPPWFAALTSPEVDNTVQGTVETVLGDDAVSGNRAIRKTKLQSALWWPQLWSPGHRLEPGVIYEFSVMVKGDLPQVNLRATCRTDSQTVKLSKPFDTPKKWTRLTYCFEPPEGAEQTSVGLSAPNGIAGEIFYDQAILRRALAPKEQADRAIPLSADPDPDPVQGLQAFMERHGHKPYDLFQRGNELLTRRLMFQDRTFGTWIWMLDDSPTVDHAGTASVWSPWNADGSTVYVGGSRILDGISQKGWFIHSDYSRMRQAPGGRPAVWAPDDPDIYFGPIGPVGNVARNNWRTGEQTIVAEWKPLSWQRSTKRLYGLTRDGRHLFVDLPNRGIFVPFEHNKAYPIPRLSLYDGRPIGPNGTSIGSNHYCVIYEHETFGDLIALRTGMLVDRKTGKRTNIAAPLCGNANYLRAFHEGRVKFPEGNEWNAYGLPWFADGVRLPTGLSMDQLYNLWLDLPHVTHGHESPSPNREFIASDGGTTLIARVRDGATQHVRLSANGTNYHLHWTKHPRFFVGWVRGWHFGSYLRPEKANIEFQVFSDGTFQPIVDTKHRLNGYYSGGDFAMFSPDATKIHYGSSMTGRFRNYIAVMARPRSPRNLSWEARGNEVHLEWDPARYSREARGTLVYRGPTSGGPYELLTSQPVTANSYADATVSPGKPYYYVVTSLEHSGLESGYSQEAARAGVDLPAMLNAPLVVYAEAEHAIRDLHTEARPGLAIGVDRHSASDWYYLYRHPDADSGQADLVVTVPQEGQYRLWVRIQAGDAGHARWTVANETRTLTADTTAREWTWIRADEQPVTLAKESVPFRLRTEARGARLDMLCLATDPDFNPEGPRPEDTTPPPPPTELQARNVRRRVNQLVWERPDAPQLSHYHVYASREPNTPITQSTRIASPSEEVLIDWGLRTETTYYYAVTAVDRRGNESPPAHASAATPPREAPRFEAELAFVDAELAGPFERSDAGGLRAKQYVVAEDPPNNRATWRIQIPAEGRYYLWLRHLLRGRGGRGQSVKQNVRVRANGQTVATLGEGRPDLNVPDRLIAENNPLAPRLWSWVWPGNENLEAATLPAGKVTVTLENLAPDVRYDVLLVTNDPSFVPQNGRLRQR